MKNSGKNLFDIFSTATVRQSVITSTSTIINGLLGVAFYILLARYLGPANFGIFSVIIITLTLFADITNVGTDTGIIKFVGKYRHKDYDKALKFLKLGLEIKLVAGILVLVVGWFLVPRAAILLGRPELAYLLRYALLGSLGVLLFSLITSAIQAFEKFTTWGVLNIFLNASRLIAIVIFFWLGNLTIVNSLWAYIAFPFLGFIIGSFFLPNYFKVERGYTVSREFFQYNRWVALFILIAAISGRLDTYLSTKLLSLRDLGIYSAALSLSSVGSQIVASIATVVSPKLAGFENRSRAIEYLKKLQMFVSVLAVLGIVIGIPLSFVIVPTLYGNEYLDSIGPFIVLLIAQAVFLFSVPAHTSVFYYFSKPSLFVWISIVHLVIIGGLGWVLISNFGFMGAAFTVLIGNISNFLIPAIWVVKKFKEK